MIILLLAFSLLHFCFYLFLSIGWSRIPVSMNKSDECGFSVIVPVRNEENVIEKLLTCLAYQSYDKSKFEVIVVDDFSEDGTVKVVKRLVKNLEISLTVISLDNVEESGKKRAITKGVEHAKYDFIITTDADCQMGPEWLASYASKSQENKFIAGPVALKGSGVFEKMQQLEFSGLIGFGAVTIESENPSMCNGANLGFSKSAFFEVGGYASNLNIPSGDDEFLLYDIQQKYPGQTTFLKNKSAIVITRAHSQISKFINQRIRWTSKWKHNKNMRLRVIAILFFLYYLIFTIGFFNALFGQVSPVLFLMLFGVHLLSHVLYILPVQRFLGLKNSISSLVLLQIIYPFHVLFMGVNSIFGGYTWKGRKY